MKVKMKMDVTLHHTYSGGITFKEGKKYKVVSKTISCYNLKNEHGFVCSVHKGYCEVCFIRRLLNKY